MRKVVLPLLVVCAVSILAGCSSSVTPTPKSSNTVPNTANTDNKMNESTNNENLTSNAVTAFDNLLKAYPKNIGFHKELDHWFIKATNDDRLEWAKNMKNNDKDLVMVLNADPFVKAGLDVKKLENSWTYRPADTAMGTPADLLLPVNISDGDSNAGDDSGKAFKAIITNPKIKLADHVQMGTYAAPLTDGYLAEWAKKLGQGDGDLYFVFLADPLVKAGLDVNKLPKGYTYQAAKTDPMMGPLPNLIIHPLSLK